MLVSGIDTNSCKVTNALKYQEDVSVKKSKYSEIPSITLDNTDTSYRVTFATPEEDNASFSSITKNSVISVAISSTDGEDTENARIRRVYVSNISAQGTITSVFEYDEDIFKVENNYLPRVIILYDNQSDLYPDDKIMAVSKITTALNEDGEEIYNLAGYSNGKMILEKCPLGVEKLPEAGDIIQYALNTKNEIKLRPRPVSSRYNICAFKS